MGRTNQKLMRLITYRSEWVKLGRGVESENNKEYRNEGVTLLRVHIVVQFHRVNPYESCIYSK